MGTDFSLNDIKLGYSDEKKAQEKKQLWLYFVARSLSFYLTWVFLKLRISANQATYISIVMGSLGCVFLAFGDYIIRIIGALFINSWIVLDCIDGNIARFQKSSSQYGEFIDALGGYIISTFLFISVGISVFNTPEPLLAFLSQQLSINITKNVLLALGFWASSASLLLMLIHHKFIALFSREEDIISNVNSSINLYTIAIYIIQNIMYISGFLMPILLLATIFRFLSVFILFYAFINSCVLIFTVTKFILKAKKLDK